MTDPTHFQMHRQVFNSVPDMGMHTFACVLPENDSDESVWQCTGCESRILGYELDDNLWQLKAGATCPAYSLALAVYNLDK